MMNSLMLLRRILGAPSPEITDDDTGGWVELAVSLLLALVCAGAYVAYVRLYLPGINGLPVYPMGGTLATAAMLAAYLLLVTPLASGIGLRWWRTRLDRQPALIWLAPAVCWLLYALFALASGQFHIDQALRLAVYVIVPVWLASRRVTWADWALVLVIAAPFIERELLRLPRVPLKKGIELETLCAVVIFLWSMMAVRRLPGFHLRWKLLWPDVRFGLGLYALYGGLAVTAGWLSGFLVWRPFTVQQNYQITDPWMTVLLHLALPFGMYLVVAIPEEMLFRGTVQNLIARSTGRPWVGLAVVSAVFGLLHFKPYDNGAFLTASGPAWFQLGYAARYMLMSALAAAVYGYAYLRTGRLTAGCVVHALVDATWLTLFNPK